MDPAREIEAIDAEIADQSRDRGRAARAKALLENPLFSEVFERLEREVLAKFKATAGVQAGAARTEALLELADKLHALQAIQGLLKKEITAGTVADAKVADLERQREFLRRNPRPQHEDQT